MHGGNDGGNGGGNDLVTGSRNCYDSNGCINSSSSDGSCNRNHGSNDVGGRNNSGGGGSHNQQEDSRMPPIHTLYIGKNAADGTMDSPSNTMATA